MDRREVEAILEQRGFTTFSTSGNGERGTVVANIKVDWSAVIRVDPMYHVIVNYSPEITTFEFQYFTTRGACKFSTGQCSPFEDEVHFNRHKKWFEEYARVLNNYELMRRPVEDE